MQRLSPNTESSAHDKRKEIVRYNYLGRALLTTEPKRASGYFSQALATSLDIQNFELIVGSYFLYGQAFLELGRTQDALSQFIAAHTLAETHGFSRPKLLCAIYEIYKSIGDFENALTYHEYYHEATKNEKLPSTELCQDIKSFLQYIAHDIKEPIRIASSYRTLLSRGLEKDGIDKYDDYLNYIKTGIGRIGNLVHTFSYYVKIDTSREYFLPVKLNEVVWMIENQLRKEHQKNIQILCDELPVVHADFERIACAMQHIIDNAIRYNNNEIPNVTIKSQSKKDYHQISIKDNGTGIALQDVDKLFDIAYSPKRHSKDPECCGMGLIISKKIIEKHKGDIWAKSTFGEGSTVYFTLPIIDLSERN